MFVLFIYLNQIYFATPPTVLNVENSKLAISNGYTIPHDVRYFMFLKSKY